MTLVHNERTKLTATWLNSIAPACVPCNSRKAAQLGWVTLDGRSGAYDPETGPVEPLKRRKRSAPRPEDPFQDHPGRNFL